MFKKPKKNLSLRKREEEEEEEETVEISIKPIKRVARTVQSKSQVDAQFKTTSMDEEKHLEAFIQQELEKKQLVPTQSKTQETPLDALYDLPTLAPKEDDSTHISCTMFTNVPELDLGILNKIRNEQLIEQALKKQKEDEPGHYQEGIEGLRFQKPTNAPVRQVRMERFKKRVRLDKPQ